MSSAETHEDQLPAAEVAAIAARARARIDTVCGGGTMPFRIWGEGPALVLFHGGSGSWTHWLRNIEALAARYRVIVPDLPGLGDAATLPKPYTPRSVAELVNAGLEHVLEADEPLQFAAFSWGCTAASQICGWRGAQVRSLTLVGPASLGEYPRPSMQPLRKRGRHMSTAELLDVSRFNLQQLMIHEPARIDALAIYLQLHNSTRARLNSPQFARTTVVLDAVAACRTPLKVIYGEFDQPSYPYVDERRQQLLRVRPDMQFEIAPDAGHWTQYEWHGFNATLLEWLAANA